MNTPARMIIVIMAAIALVGIGFAIASLIQSGPTVQKDVTFALLIKTPGDFNVTMGPVNPDTGDVELTVTRGTPAVFTVNVTAVNGWDSPITLDVSGLPANVTYSFGTNPIPPGGSTTLTIQTTNLQSGTAYVLTLTGTGD